MAEKQTEGAFVFEPAKQPPVGSVLYEKHLKLTDKSHIAEFAGYLMPLWYSSIAEEHSAIRHRAGVFDCTHMGALEIAGPNAESFLDMITTNNVRVLQVGSAQYSYLLDAAGNVLDDIIIYRRDKEKFMVVVNASNEPKARAYLAALQAGKAKIDLAKPGRQIKTATVRNMRDTKTGSDCRVDIALQGPRSVEVLSKLDKTTGQRAGELKSFNFFEGKIAGIDCIISRTGYTGEKVCFELFVHPENAAKLWQRLFDAGGVPCGLGARDSLRVEAGLPLYGHELAGQYNISPFEAGYGWAVKLDKEFFIGKPAMEKISRSFDMQVARIELPGEKGVRPVRQNDGIIRDGVCIGWVLSCAKAGERQIALAYAAKGNVAEGNSVGVYYLARSESQKSKGRKETVARGERLEADIAGKIISRFEKF
ncbi:MAG: glycine cleavage system aminomethyltransferase GcvT [Sedimentisphaerales bacterium]